MHPDWKLVIEQILDKPHVLFELRYETLSELGQIVEKEITRRWTENLILKSPHRTVEELLAYIESKADS